jgi:DNA damage-binding protein 1
MPSPLDNEPTIAFLWLSSNSELLLQSRKLSPSSHSFIDSSEVVNVVMPLHSVEIYPETDFNEVPYSCPAARRLLPVSAETLVVIGDEHSVYYTLSKKEPRSPRVSRGSISSQAGVSPRASATSRSPQAELSAPGKRRKGSESRESDGLSLRPLWRVRQGFGTILA